MIVYTARWVLPVSRPSFENGAVGVENGRLAYVGPSDGAPAGERRDLGECALMPGLVNVHTHLELTAMRGWLEALPFRKWIIRLTKARKDVLTPERLLASARVGIAEGLLAGVTTYADTCESGVVHEALRTMGVRGIMYLEVFGPHPEQAAESLRSLGTRVAALRDRDSSRVRTGISPHAPYSVSDALFRGAADMAIADSLPIAVHIAESSAEQRLVTEGEGDFADALRARGIPVTARAASPVELLAQTGVLRAGPLLIHCVQASRSDMRLIADCGAAIAHCPASNAKLGHGSADLTSMIEANVRVGLGSDSVASNNRMDILDEARLAVLFARERTQHWNTISPALAIELATLRGAQALGLENDIGSLDIGKAADLAAFPLSVMHTTPMQDPESALVFAASGRGASLVMVDGVELVADGHLVTDIARDVASVRQAASELRRLPHAADRWKTD